MSPLINECKTAENNVWDGGSVLVREKVPSSFFATHNPMTPCLQLQEPPTNKHLVSSFFFRRQAQHLHLEIDNSPSCCWNQPTIYLSIHPRNQNGTNYATSSSSFDDEARTRRRALSHTFSCQLKRETPHDKQLLLQTTTRNRLCIYVNFTIIIDLPLTKTNQDDDLDDNHSLGSIDSLDWTLLVEWHDDNDVRQQQLSSRTTLRTTSTSLLSATISRAVTTQLLVAQPSY